MIVSNQRINRNGKRVTFETRLHTIPGIPEICWSDNNAQCPNDQHNETIPNYGSQGECPHNPFGSDVQYLLREACGSNCRILSQGSYSTDRIRVIYTCNSINCVTTENHGIYYEDNVYDGWYNVDF